MCIRDRKKTIYIVILYCNALDAVHDMAQVKCIRIYPDNPKIIILVTGNQGFTGAGPADRIGLGLHPGMVTSTWTMTQIRHNQAYFQPETR